MMLFIIIIIIIILFSEKHMLWIFARIASEAILTNIYTIRSTNEYRKVAHNLFPYCRILYNSKFILAAKSLETNGVVIKGVHCI